MISIIAAFVSAALMAVATSTVVIAPHTVRTPSLIAVTEPTEPPVAGPDGWKYGTEDGQSTIGQRGSPARRPAPPKDEGDESGRVASAADPVCGRDNPNPPSECQDTSMCNPWGAAGGCQPGPIAGAPVVPAVSPQDLLQRAVDELRLPVPRMRTAPPRGTNGMVGLPEWFWLDPDQAVPLTRRLEVGSVWVELTASPQQMAITPGPGLAAVSCPGGGVPYGGQLAPPAGACTHTYVRSSAGLPGSAYRVVATVRWGGTWRGSGGVGGALPPITRSSVLSVRVAEGQALTGGAR